MAYYAWFTDQDDGKFLLIDADGYMSMECCCRPCVGVPDDLDPNNESCPCYGMGSADAPLLLELITTCDSCWNENRMWLCWGSTTPIDTDVWLCKWGAGDAGDMVDDGECYIELTCYIQPGYDPYWELYIYDNSTPAGQAFYGVYSGTWDCESEMVFDNQYMNQYYSCEGEDASIVPFEWVIPS